jgi:hypothetical protein
MFQIFDYFGSRPGGQNPQHNQPLPQNRPRGAAPMLPLRVQSSIIAGLHNLYIVQYGIIVITSVATICRLG